MKTRNPRIKIENYGAANWRTVVQDDCGDWAITGPPYATRSEALIMVSDLEETYFK